MGIMPEILATNVVASRPPNSDRLQRRPLVPIINFKPSGNNDDDVVDVVVVVVVSVVVIVFVVSVVVNVVVLIDVVVDNVVCNFPFNFCARSCCECSSDLYNIFTCEKVRNLKVYIL